MVSKDSWVMVDLPLGLWVLVLICSIMVVIGSGWFGWSRMVSDLSFLVSVDLFDHSDGWVWFGLIRVFYLIFFFIYLWWDVWYVVEWCEKNSMSNFFFLVTKYRWLLVFGVLIVFFLSTPSIKMLPLLFETIHSTSNLRDPDALYSKTWRNCLAQTWQTVHPWENLTKQKKAIVDKYYKVCIGTVL